VTNRYRQSSDPRSPFRTAAHNPRLGQAQEGRAHRGEQGQEEDDDIQGVYIISVAARILEMHPQTLRKYERVGLISPFRTIGIRRLYSEEDIARLRLIKHLVGDLGLNLAGVQLVLDLFNQLLAMRAQVDALEGDDLRDYVQDKLEEMLRLLQTGPTSDTLEGLTGDPDDDE
jgi:MerR family transcriptional regulator/heat shock protein HspR